MKENWDERSKSLPRGRNRFFMEKKGNPSRLSTNYCSWARWSQEVLSSLNESVKHRHEEWGPQEQHTRHNKRRFLEKVTEHRIWVSLTDTCTVRTKWGGDVVCSWEGPGLPTPSMILIQKCHGGCWSYKFCHCMIGIWLFENLSCVIYSERRVRHVMQLDLHLA